MLLKVVLTPGESTLMSNFREGIQCELWVFLSTLPHWGSVPTENSFYRAPVGKRAQETCAGCPQQRNATGKPGKLQSRDRVGIVEGSCGYWYSGKIRFIEKSWVQYEGVAMLLNVVLTPGKANPQSNFRDGTQCELWVLWTPFPHWGRNLWKNRFFEALVGNGPRRCVPRESQINNFRVGIVEGSWPVGSVFGENSFYRETFRYKTRGSPYC